MTQDAHTEAERAVKDLLIADRRTDTDDGMYAQSRLIVGVLAAAIEWQDSRWCQGVRSVEAAERLRSANHELQRAVSALREAG